MPTRQEAESTIPFARRPLEYAEVCGPSERTEDLRALVARLNTLPQTEHIPSEVVAHASRLSISGSHPFAVIDHGPNLTTAEKIQILSQKKNDILAQLGVNEIIVLPLKTITLRVKYKGKPQYMLVCGIGNFSLDRQTKIALGPAIRQLFGVETNVLNKGTRINPPEFKPADCLGLCSGIVSPFFPKSQEGRESPKLSGLLYCQERDFTGLVALPVSLTETLIIDQDILRLTLNWWLESSQVMPLWAFKKVSL